MSAASSSSSDGRSSTACGFGIRKTITNFFSHPNKSPTPTCKTKLAKILCSVNRKLRRLGAHLRWSICRRPNSDTIIISRTSGSKKELVEILNNTPVNLDSAPSIRLATFNAAMFSMAPAGRPLPVVELDVMSKSANDRPKGILREKSYKKPKKMRVSINLPDNEISLSARFDKGRSSLNSKPADIPVSSRTVLDVLREAGADVVALQNVKAEEEKGMSPLAELADGLGMKFVFAESWAPEYGNAILSRWPIKNWKVQKISDDSDHRNVLKATIDVPMAGELNFHCTHLDHLDERWRMKQINKILLYSSTEGPHILAGGLNSLDDSDYSQERWNDILKYYEEIGKPKPKPDVMKFLRERRYVDAKNFAGECESVVVIAKGQDVQGTCKYGTRVDYILASPNSPYSFVPGSYTVVSSKGTSDHHIVKVDIKISSQTNSKRSDSSIRRSNSDVVRIKKGSSSGIVWSTDS